MSHSFRPGDAAIWWKDAGGGFVAPVSATVVAVTAKRVTIQAMDPDDTGAGLVTRHVSPARLEPQAEAPSRRRPRGPVARGKARPQKAAAPPADSVEARYPNIASWVQDGWIEVGRDDSGRSFVRALDCGGLVWEGDGPYASLDEALRALDAGIASWVQEMS
jgi:hypothetical protein